MKRVSTAMAAMAVMMMSSAAAGQEMQTWSGQSTLSDVKVVGGVGAKANNYRSASWTQTANLTGSDGQTNVVTSSCVGMDQPPGALYDRHVTCNSSTGESSGSSVMGCQLEKEDGTEMSCTGYFQGKTGAVKDHAALVTEYYRFTEGGKGNTRTTGHWIR